MHILISNDDGYSAPGIKKLRQHLLQKNHRVTIIAPDKNRSACSSSLTVRNTLMPIEVEKDVWMVENGTPADCIHLAVYGFFDFQPDVICSGINNESNLGDDIIYSGTVAAILEARNENCPKLAISVAHSDYFDSAAEITVNIMNQLIKNNSKDMLNINVPALPLEAIKGIRSTRLGSRKKSHPIIEKTAENGKKCYLIGPSGDSEFHQNGTDFEALDLGFVSVTPLTIDMTDHLKIDSLNNILIDE